MDLNRSHIAQAKRRCLFEGLSLGFIVLYDLIALGCKIRWSNVQCGKFALNLDWILANIILLNPFLWIVYYHPIAYGRCFVCFVSWELWGVLLKGLWRSELTCLVVDLPDLMLKSNQVVNEDNIVLQVLGYSILLQLNDGCPWPVRKESLVLWVVSIWVDQVIIVEHILSG